MADILSADQWHFRFLDTSEEVSRLQELAVMPVIYIKQQTRDKLEAIKRLHSYDELCDAVEHAARFLLQKSSALSHKKSGHAHNQYTPISTPLQDSER